MSTPATALVGALAPGAAMFEYRIERVLGHGGFGITYLAHDTHLDKRVAIKEYLPNELAARAEGDTVSVRSEESREAFDWGRSHFVKEARVLARFSHPSLIQVHRFFELNGTAYFVMEYAEGTTLAVLLKRETTQPQDRIRAILLPILTGLEQVHLKGVLHRDIKPDNIILREDGSPVLIDFGAARQNIGAASVSIMSVVTAGYAPLEQYGAAGSQGPWTDIYALGAVAYRMVTGKKPLDAVNRIGSSDPVSPAAVLGAGKYAPHFLAAIDWALGVQPENRPQSIAGWREALDGIVALPATVRRKSQPEAEAATQTNETFDDLPTAIIARRSTAPAPAVATSPSPATVPAAKSPAAKWVLPAGAAIVIAIAAAGFFLKQSPKEATPDVSTPVTATPAPESGTSQAQAPSASVPEKAREETKPKAPSSISPAPASSPATTAAGQTKAQDVPSSSTRLAEPATSSEEKNTSGEQPSSATAKPQTEPPAAPAPKPKTVPISTMAARSSFQDCPQCPVMTVLPSSSFVMGSKADTPGAAAWEGPAHKVLIGKPIAMGQYEVTASEWQQCAKAHACAAAKAGPGKADANHTPVVFVNWPEAQKYTAWLTETTGRRYRLPSEAEWEFAVRAGTATARFWGEDRRLQCEHANGADLSGLQYDSKLPAGQQPCDDDNATLAAVGSFKPNGFNLHDMAGNVWEWTLDCWKDSYTGVPADGSAVDVPGCAKRVIRGGSWRTKPESLRSANRGLSPMDFKSEDLGFRVVAE